MLEVDLKWTIEWNSCSHSLCFPLVKLHVASYLFSFQFVTSISSASYYSHVVVRCLDRRLPTKLASFICCKYLMETHLIRFFSLSFPTFIRFAPRWDGNQTTVSPPLALFFLLVFTALFSINVIPFPTFGYIVQPLFFSSLPLSRSRPLSWHREQQQQSLGSDSQGQFIKKVCRKLPFFIFFLRAAPHCCSQSSSLRRQLSHSIHHILRVTTHTHTLWCKPPTAPPKARHHGNQSFSLPDHFLFFFFFFFCPQPVPV